MPKKWKNEESEERGVRSEERESAPVVDDNPPAPFSKGEEFVLVYHSPLKFGDKTYRPGDKIDEDAFNRVPKKLQPRFWKNGTELEPRVYAKLPRELQKYFKVKS